MEYLEEHGEEDDGYGSGHEQRLLLHFIRVDEQHESEGYGASQTAVRHDEFLYFVQLVQAEPVRELSESDNTWCRKKQRQ